MRRRGLLLVSVVVGLLGVAMVAVVMVANGFALAGGEGQPSQVQSSLGVRDVSAKLQAKGLKANSTGETIPPLFGAKAGETVRADGKAVQVYVFEDAVSAGKALSDASQGPGGRVVEWVARPHFVQMGNLLVTIVTDDEAFAASVTAALQ
jgi:hypothetical protein